MLPIAKQKCVEIRQEIHWTEKRIIESSFHIILDKKQLLIKDEKIPISKILDISYRIDQKQSAIGYLYLHTIHGVRTFHIREDPTYFIEIFKKIRSETEQYG
ncbi:hypothetical protein BTS2_2784 [Bacillus sp. TS-2]|nr:hypothetical protein BTS2_2784 [Bacillus sp. TS-2]